MPDAFIFALVATLVVVVAGVAATPSTLLQVVDAWGRGFWELIPFTLQMALVIITGHVLATSPPMGRVIRAIAGVAAIAARRGRAGHVLRAGQLVDQLGLQPDLQRGAGARGRARRVEGVDYRALAAASFLGLGSIWAQGLSGSAALQMATPGALPAADPRHRRARRPRARRHHLVPPHDLSCGRASSSVAVEIVVVTTVMWLATPPRGPRPHGARSRHRSRPGHEANRHAG